jgi:hypothetical protein
MKKLTKEYIPQGFKWAAVEPYGAAFAFAQKPIREHNGWKCNGVVEWIGYEFDSTDWQNSLVGGPLNYLTADDIPEGYKFAAVDKDGVAYAYKAIPTYHLNDSCWYATDEENSLLRVGEDFDATNWTTSLVEKKTLKKLTVKDIPTLKWAAVDATGIAFAYTEKPTLGERSWITTEPKDIFHTHTYLFIGRGFDSSDWQNSLISLYEWEIVI